MNFVEFISLPTYLVEILTEIAGEEEAKKAAAINNLNNEFK